MKKVALLPFFALALTAVFAGSKDKTLDVYWIDSEGGGATLIVTPSGESVLIDAGNPGGRDAARIVAVAKLAGLSHIDHFMLTHFHGDHFGGAAELAQLLPFRAIYQRAIPEKDPDGKASSPFLTQIKPFRELAAKRVPLVAGVTIPLKAVAKGPALSLRCLGADQKFIAPADIWAPKNPLSGTGDPRKVNPSDNDNSAVFVLQFGAFRFFDGGDLTWNLEEQLVTPNNLAGVVDVYQTNHHGNADSSNPILLKSVAPTVVVMNNGPRKGGQSGAFVAIKSAPTVKALYQLHKSLTASPADNAPDEFIANLEEGKPADQCTANYIKMVVAADAKSYTISIPGTGHAHTYQTRVE